MTDYHRNFVTSFDRIAEILERTRRIAVLGMKTEAQRGQPALDVPRYMADHGYDVVPVPVYYPEVTHILGRKVYRSVADVPPPVDMVNVFRRSQDVAAHVDDIIAAKPRIVWMQLGIANPAAAEAFARAGIEVVQDRCLMVDHARYLVR
jgi:predicted CoA-binding protein